MNSEKISTTEALNMFNAFAAEVRDKINDLIKQILFLSGGIQAITIGAFLGGSPPQFPACSVDLLRFGWFSLSLSMVLCLLFMLVQVVAMSALGFRLKRKLEQPERGAEVMFAPFWLRLLSWVIGLPAFISCCVGIITLSGAAMALIGATSA